MKILYCRYGKDRLRDYINHALTELELNDVCTLHLIATSLYFGHLLVYSDNELEVVGSLESNELIITLTI